MNILMIYRMKRYREEIAPRLAEYAGDNITILCEKHVEALGLRYFDKEGAINNIYLIQDLLEGKLDDMKFDYIVGNPPYQYPKGVSTNKKLYIDISKKIIDLLKSDGEMSFITPMGILDDGQQNTIYNKIKDGINKVDYTVNKCFNIGQSVIEWNYSHQKSKDIKIIEETGVRFVSNLSLVCQKHHILSNSILNKLSYKINGRKKLPLFNTDKKFGVDNKNIHDTKSEGDIEVYCNTKRQRIKYTNIDNKPEIETQLIIPYIGGWDEGCQITDRVTNKFFYVNKFKLRSFELQNLKVYIESKIVTFAVHKFKESKMSSHFNFLSRLSDLPLDEKWTDEKLYKEFKITSEEQKEIEDWYEQWNNK